MKLVRQTAPALFAALLSVAAIAAPDGYSINSDSGSTVADSLFRIDLATGQETLVGKVLSLSTVRRDTEGLAFAPDGRLWGVDDDSLTLFPIDVATGVVAHTAEVALKGFPSGGGNDFGLSFTCTGDLYATSVVTRTLYRIAPDGTATPVGAEGALGAPIGSLAAYGEPPRLYGLGNGESAGSGAVRALFRIDARNGTATKVGDLGGSVGEYTESGLSFDSTGQLWAITDRRIVNGQDLGLPSEVLKIDQATGRATVVGTTKEVGFEGLAVAPPAGCSRAVKDGAEYAPIPTLGAFGGPLTALLVLAMGLAALHRRSHP